MKGTWLYAVDCPYSGGATGTGTAYATSLKEARRVAQGEADGQQTEVLITRVEITSRLRKRELFKRLLNGEQFADSQEVVETVQPRPREEAG